MAIVATTKAEISFAGYTTWPLATTRSIFPLDAVTSDSLGRRRRILCAIAAVISALMIAASARASEVLFYGTPGEAMKAQMMLDLQSVAMNMAKVKYGKEGLGREIADARGAVIQSCKSGVRDEADESRLVRLLDAKDFWYMPFYWTGEQGLLAAAAMDKLTGGRLDGGNPS